MASYEPPTEIDPIFNSLAFQSPNNVSITKADADLLYLARTGVATSIATTTSFSGQGSFTGEVAATSWTSLNSGAVNFHIDNLAGNGAPLVIRNQSTGFDTFYRQFGTTKSHIFTTNNAVTTNLTLSNTMNTSALPFTFSKQSLSTPGAVITATVSLALPLNDIYFITAAGAITVSLPTNAAAYSGSHLTFRRTATGGIITVDQTGGASALQPAGSTTTATTVSIAAATVTFEFISNGTLWCQL